MVKGISVKGFTQNGDKSMLVISANKKNYTLMQGELTLVQMPGGDCRIRLVEVGADGATLEVNGQETVLRIH